MSTSRQSPPPSPHAAALLCMNYRGKMWKLCAQIGPRAVSLFPLKGFQPGRRSSGGVGGAGGRGGEGRGGGPEGGD